MGGLSPSEKRRIAGRARTVQERLEDGGDHEWTADNVDKITVEWEQKVADGNPAVFQKRLQREDLSLDEYKAQIAANGWPAEKPLPDWIDKLDDILGYIDEQEQPVIDNENDDQRAFTHVYEPLIDYAWQLTDAPDSNRITQAAKDDFRDWLELRFERLCSHTLFIEFKTHIARDNEELVFGDDPDIDPESTAYYEEFVHTLLDNGLKSFVMEYSLLSRMLVSVLHDWAERYTLLVNRLLADWESIEETFSPGDSLAKVTEINSTGDPHQKGKTVLGVTFDTGLTIAYKPRNSGMVAAFYDFLEWVNDNSTLLSFQTLDVLTRDAYAWMEWVKPTDCESRDGGPRYYRRAGMFICLFYAFDATDMHLVNIIANGEHPIPIDLETLSQPEVREKYRAVDERLNVAKNTVARTGAVPLHAESEDVGVAGGFGDQHLNVDFEMPVFENINTDLMDLETTAVPPLRGKNLPKYDGEVLPSEEHTDDLVAGFEEMYQFILDNKTELLAEHGPIERLIEKEGRVRALYRSTQVYGQLKDSMSKATFQRTGLQSGVELEQLADLLVSNDLDNDVWDICETEWETLLNFNIPRFNAKVDSRDLYSENEVVIEAFFRKKPAEHIRERISEFTESDREEQMEYLKLGFGDYTQKHTATNRTLPEEPSANLGDFEEFASTTVQEIYDRINTSAQYWDEAPTWIRREVSSEGGLHIREVGDGVYEGRLGIGIFAAAVAQTFENPQARAFAEDIVSPVVTKVNRDEQLPADELGESIGGADGFGSVVYGLTKMGQLLGDEQYFDAARTAATQITPERINADEQYDILYGSAGAIAGLLALYEQTGDDDVLERAILAGEHLLAERTDENGVPVWEPAVLDQPLCGFSHGVAGIAYPLYRLGDVTGDARFTDAALESIEYEHQQYNETQQNWPEHRSGTDSEWMDSWCHGRTGIGLARLGMYEVAEDERIQQDIERALDGVDTETMAAVDHVCCGNFGTVEFLQRAGITLEDETCEQQARQLASAAIEHAKQDGQFATHWQTEQWYNPSFFDGEAGIGYTLLRAIDPSLPCVLLWR